MRHVAYVAIMSVAGLLWGCETINIPLVAGPEVDTPAAKHNAEGVARYKVADWDGAKKHFESAIQADPGLVESHFNLGLALDKLGKHPEAAAHFKRAAELAPGDPVITESSAYRSHVRPPPGFGSSGYGGGGGY